MADRPAKLTQRQLADNTVKAVTARLAIIPGVAWNKFVSHARVEDPVRDQVVIGNFAAAVAPAHVRKGTAKRIAKDQIAASCSVQYSLIAQWSMGLLPAPEGTPPSLTNVLRPQIDAATADLAKSIRQAQRHAKQATWTRSVKRAEARVQSSLPAGVTSVILRQALEEITYWRF